MSKLIHIAGGGGNSGVLANSQPGVGRKELGEIQCGQVKVVAGQWMNLTAVHWHKRSGVLVDGRGPITLSFQVQKSARPQAELLAIYIYYDVAPPAVLPRAALAAINNALANLGDIQIEG